MDPNSKGLLWQGPTKVQRTSGNKRQWLVSAVGEWQEAGNEGSEALRKLQENACQKTGEKQQKGSQETILINLRTDSTEQDGIIQSELAYEERVTRR